MNQTNTSHVDAHPFYCGVLADAMTSNEQCEGFVRVERGRTATASFIVIIGVAILFGLQYDHWRKNALIRRAFNSLDKDQDGTLDAAEMEKMFKKLRIEMTKAQVNEATHEMDRDWSGEVNLDEFTAWWHKFSHRYEVSMTRHDLFAETQLAPPKGDESRLSSRASSAGSDRRGKRFAGDDTGRILGMDRPATPVRLQQVKRCGGCRTLNVLSALLCDVYYRRETKGQIRLTNDHIKYLWKKGFMAKGRPSLMVHHRHWWRRSNVLLCVRWVFCALVARLMHWVQAVTPGSIRGCCQASLMVLWALALPLFLGETLFAVWGWVVRQLCGSCSLRGLLCCCKKGKNKYAVDPVSFAQGKGVRSLAHSWSLLPKKRRSCYHPSIYICGLAGYAGFAAMINGAIYILWVVAPAAIAEREETRTQRMNDDGTKRTLDRGQMATQTIAFYLTGFIGVVLLVNFVSVGIFGYTRHRTMVGNHAPLKHLSGGKRALVVWETFQLTLFHMELKQGRWAGMLGQAFANVAFFTWVNYSICVMVCIVIVAVVAARAGLAAFISSTALRSGLMVSAESTQISQGWLAAFASVTVMMKLAQSLACSLHEAPPFLIPERWDGLGLSDQFTLNVSPDIVCWEGDHKYLAVVCLVAILCFVPASVWVELPSERDDASETAAYFGIRTTCKAAIILLSVVHNADPVSSLSISFGILLWMGVAHAVLTPAGMLHDDFDGNFLLLGSVITPMWAIGAMWLGLENGGVATCSGIPIDPAKTCSGLTTESVGGKGETCSGQAGCTLNNYTYDVKQTTNVMIYVGLTLFWFVAFVASGESVRFRRWRQVCKAISELRRGCAAMENTMNVDDLAGKSWEELRSAKIDTMGVTEDYTEALEHFDNARILHMNSIVLGWRATALENMGLFEQSKSEAEEALILLDPIRNANVGSDDNKYAEKMFESHLDVSIPLPNKSDLEGLIKRVVHRSRISACNKVIRLAAHSLGDRALEVESPGAKRSLGEGAFEPVAAYRLASAAELRQLSAAYCERGVSMYRLVESGSGGVHEKYDAWCDVQQTKELDRMYKMIADDPDDWEDGDDDGRDPDKPPFGDEKVLEEFCPIIPHDGPGRTTWETNKGGHYKNVDENLEEQRAQIATELLAEAKIATDGFTKSSSVLIAQSLNLCASWRGHWMQFERSRKFTERADALHMAMEFNDALVEDEDVRKKLEPFFGSDRHREYRFESAAEARRYREIDLCHTRALLNYANAHPLNGVIEMDFLQLAWYRQAQDAEEPPPPLVLPFLWNKAVMLEAGGALQDAHESFLQIVELTEEHRAIHDISSSSSSSSNDEEDLLGLPEDQGLGLSMEGLQEVADALYRIYEEHNPKKLSSIIPLLEEWKGEELMLLANIKEKYGVVDPEPEPEPEPEPGWDQPKRVLDYWAIPGARSRGGGRGKVYFQLCLPGPGWRVRPRTLPLNTFDFNTHAKASVMRVEDERAEFARKKVKISSGWDSQPGQPTKAKPKWMVEAAAAEEGEREQRELRGRAAIRPPRGEKQGAGVVRRQTGLRMTLPVLANGN